MRYVSDTLQQWYSRTPVWTRSLASSMYGALKSRRESTQVFEAAMQAVRETQWLSRERLGERQANQLESLVRYVARKVPYYERLFADHGIAPSSIQTVDDLRRVPTLTRDDIRTHWKDLISRDAAQLGLRKESTSGTTGAPLSVWMDDETYLHTKAVQWLQHEWAGYFHTEWLGILAGYRVVPLNRSRPPFWVTNLMGRQVHFSSYHLRPDMLGHYVEKLRKSEIRFLLGYPSAIGLLAQYFVERNLTHPIRAVFLSSEPLYEWQSEAIQKAFGCTIYNYYGQAERVLSGMSCGNSLNLHLEMDSSVVEFVPLPGGGGRSMIVATSLVNRAMPLLRYELNDVTTPIAAPCRCGRALPLIRPVETKREDVVTTSTGRLLPPSLFTFPLKNAVGVLQSQIVQQDPRNLEVRVVTDLRFTKEEAARLLKEYRSLVDQELDVAINIVDRIPLTSAGKFRFVVSHVARGGLIALVMLMLLAVPLRRGSVRAWFGFRAGRSGRVLWQPDVVMERV
jgi:phenylacetate-CoA ligase